VKEHMVTQVPMDASALLLGRSVVRASIVKNATLPLEIIFDVDSEGFTMQLRDSFGTEIGSPHRYNCTPATCPRCGK